MSRVAATLPSILSIAAGHMPGSGDAIFYSSAGTQGAHAVAVKASKNLGTLGGGALDTVVRAKRAGAAGNHIKISAAADSATGAGVTIAITKPAADYIVAIHFEAGVSTVHDVETAIGALAGGQALIEVATPGTGATVLTGLNAVFAATALSSGTDPVGMGHLLSGLYADEAIVYLTVSAWGAAAGLEVFAERSLSAEDNVAAASWGVIEPAADGLGTGTPHVVTTSGKTVIPNTVATGQPIALRVRCPGAKRLRIGIRQSAGVADGTVACSASMEILTVVGGPR